MPTCSGNSANRTPPIPPPCITVKYKMIFPVTQTFGNIMYFISNQENLISAMQCFQEIGYQRDVQIEFQVNV